VDTVLRGASLAGPDTTRSQLVNYLTIPIDSDPAFALFTYPTVEAIADRALACGAVKPDPSTSAAQLSSRIKARSILPALSSQR